MRLPPVLAAIASLATLASCNSSSTTSTDAGSADTGSTDAASIDAGLNPSDCPASLPDAGAPCAIPAAETCNYYGGGTCVIGTTCTSGAWAGRTHSPGCSFINSPTCPASFGAAVATGSSCPTQAECAYDEGLCNCLVCVGPAGAGGGTFWDCAAWPSPPGCPALAPTPGTPC